MEFKEIDKLIKETLNSRYPKNTERRDYYKLERNWIKKDANHKIGHADRNGIMYLTDVDDSHYIDVRILKKDVVLTFRYDDYILMNRVFSYEDFTKNNILYFFYAIDYFLESYLLFNKFNSGEIPIDFIRENKLNEIL